MKHVKYSHKQHFGVCIPCVEALAVPAGVIQSCRRREFSSWPYLATIIAAAPKKHKRNALLFIRTPGLRAGLGSSQGFAASRASCHPGNRVGGVNGYPTDIRDGVSVLRSPVGSRLPIMSQFSSRCT